MEISNYGTIQVAGPLTVTGSLLVGAPVTGKLSVGGGITVAGSFA